MKATKSISCWRDCNDFTASDTMWKCSMFSVQCAIIYCFWNILCEFEMWIQFGCSNCSLHIIQSVVGSTTNNQQLKQFAVKISKFFAHNVQDMSSACLMFSNILHSSFMPNNKFIRVFNFILELCIPWTITNCL